jgi:hypothetical protein
VLWISMMVASSSLRILGAAPAGILRSDSAVTILLEANASSAVAGESIALSGSVRPYVVGQMISIDIDRGHGWEGYASGQTSNGSFSFTFKADSQGLYRFKATIASQGAIYESEEVTVRFWPASIFSRLLIEDAHPIDLAELRLFRRSLSRGSALDRGIYSAFVFVNGVILPLADDLLWPLLRFALYPALWSLLASEYVFMASGNAALALISYSLLFGLSYLTIPIALIGYLSKIGLTTIRGRRDLGIPVAVAAISFLIMWASPFPELVSVSALLAFASTALLPSLALAKLLYL